MSGEDYGPAWLRSNGKVLSPEGVRVARFCNWLFDGIYHQQDAVLKADWSRFYVALRLYEGLATFDFNGLTRLVVGAHDFCIRVDIEPCSPKLLGVVFHPRHLRLDGGFAERHPTMEAALAKMNRMPLDVAYRPEEQGAE